MKNFKLILIALLIALTTIITPTPVSSSTKEIAYFREESCLECQRFDNSGKKQILIDAGVTIHDYNIQSFESLPAWEYLDNNDNIVEVTANDVFAAFNKEYNRSKTTVPVIFVGDTYIEGTDEIIDAIERGTVTDLSSNPLLVTSVEPGTAYEDLTFWGVLVAGFLDGFNPCAIALLLLFVSLLGFSDDKLVLILVSIVYISALYASYFLIGTFFLGVLDQFETQLTVISQIINWFVVLLCFGLFIFNFYDYIQAKNEDYGKIKNQLPKWVQRYNKKIVKAFTNVINDKENKKGLFAVLGITFVLGITVSITELVCTGQIYIAVLYGVHVAAEGAAYIYLIFYNLMFVLPLIVIAVISIRSRSIGAVSNWIREHMQTIKLSNALLFLVIALFFLLRVFGIDYHDIIDMFKNLFK